MKTGIEKTIQRILKNRIELGITLYKSASYEEISEFETRMGVKLPDDIKTFYSLCNGLESSEDIFRIIPLDEIIKNGKDNCLTGSKDFNFAEYMIYSDTWTISIDEENSNSYYIYYNAGNPIRLTNSLSVFLEKFLDCGVFEGLYEWHAKADKKEQDATVCHEELTPEQKALAEFMSAISEKCYNAGWLYNLEYVLWNTLEGGPRKYGQDAITQEDIDQLIQLYSSCNCWIYFDDDKEETAIDLVDWRHRYLNEIARNPELLN